jgi:hypothetical protein
MKMKIKLPIILSMTAVLIGATTGLSYNIVYGQNTVPQSNSTNFSIKGTITHEVNDFHMSGPAELIVQNGKVVDFRANMTAILPNAMKYHSHYMNTFHQDPGTEAQLNMNNSGKIKGTVNIGLNEKLDEWSNVPVTISVIDGKIISIVLNDSASKYPAPPEGPVSTADVHFTSKNYHNPDPHGGSQPIIGIIRELIRTYTIVN